MYRNILSASWTEAGTTPKAMNEKAMNSAKHSIPGLFTPATRGAELRLGGTVCDPSPPGL